MRPTPSSAAVVLDDVFVGINLGADYCAEHEWGIGRLNTELGVGTAGDIGIESRRTKPLTDGQMVVFETALGAVLLCGVEARRAKRDGGPMVEVSAPSSFYTVTDKAGRESYKKLTPKSGKKAIAQWAAQAAGFYSRWSEDSFAVTAIGDVAKAQLQEVAEAARKGDLVVMLGGGNAFANPGLCVFIESRVPAEAKEMMRTADEKAIRLKAAAEATGIAEVLRQHGRLYYALSPRWVDDTEAQLLFWLNPRDQQRNHAGWVTESDLHHWAVGTGVIPTKASGGARLQWDLAVERLHTPWEPEQTPLPSTVEPAPEEEPAQMRLL